MHPIPHPSMSSNANLFMAVFSFTCKFAVTFLTDCNVIIIAAARLKVDLSQYYILTKPKMIAAHWAILTDFFTYQGMICSLKLVWNQFATVLFFLLEHEPDLGLQMTQAIVTLACLVSKLSISEITRISQGKKLK